MLTRFAPGTPLHRDDGTDDAPRPRGLRIVIIAGIAGFVVGFVVARALRVVAD